MQDNSREQKFLLAAALEAITKALVTGNIDSFQNEDLKDYTLLLDILKQGEMMSIFNEAMEKLNARKKIEDNKWIISAIQMPQSLIPPPFVINKEDSFFPSSNSSSSESRKGAGEVGLRQSDNFSHL